jgi:hypothetical protein
MAASVPAFRSSLANAGKMPALLEAGASRPPLPKNLDLDHGFASFFRKDPDFPATSRRRS